MPGAEKHETRSPEGTEMKIANWNLERALPSQTRANTIRERMSEVDADIWILTETHEELSPGVGFSGVFSGEPDQPSKIGERWVGIWSRHRTEPLGAFVSDGARCAAARISIPNSRDIIVFGCVLPWVGSAWRDTGSEHGAFDAALHLYLVDWRRLRSANPDAVFVAAGDFNQDLAERHYYGSKRQRLLLESALESAGLTALTGGDGDPIARDSSPCACIDHICISNEPTLPVKRTTRWPDLPAPDKRISDHFGVAVEFCVRP